MTRCNFANADDHFFVGNKGRIKETNEILYVPIVFHVVYASSNQNISNDQIYSQLAVINEDFGRKNKDTVNTLSQFSAVAGNPRIQFYIAQANGISGITRTPTSHGPFYNDDLHRTDTGGKDGWDSQNYLNVWIAVLAPGILGYGNGPGTSSFRDGVAVHYEYFGRSINAVAPFNLGRTLTHEVGHWLGLQHPWGSGGCDSDDGMTDTPVQDEATVGCVLNRTSCGTLSMVQNFMNTSDDACMNLFTQQQAAAMRNTLLTSRSSAYSNAEVITETENANSTAVVTYPNPVRAQRYAIIRLPHIDGESFQVLIYDDCGRLQRNVETSGNYGELKIDLAELANGFYVARIFNETESYSTKIILNTNP